MREDTEKQEIENILKTEPQKVKKHRGRPKRVIVEGQDPVESNVKTITDPLMEPYYIKASQYGFEVVELIQPDLNHNPDAKPYPQNVGYYANFNNCLEKIAVRKLNDKSYKSLKDYVQEFNKITEELKTLTQF